MNLLSKTLIALFLLSGSGIFAQDGVLDGDFDADGIVITSIGNHNDYCYDIDVQSDSKVLTVGTNNNGTKDLIAVLRYNIDGTLDHSFGDEGIAFLNFGPSNRGASLVIQPDGKILIGATITNSFQFDFSVSRLNSDGTLDKTFGNSGQQSVDFSGNADFCRSIHLLSNSKILLTGTASNGTDNDFAIARFNADGILDTTFAGIGKGKNFFNIGGDDYCESSAVLPDDKIILFGYSNVDGNNDFVLVKLNPDGTVDETFGVNGKVVTEIGTKDDYGRSVAMQPDGKILTGGYASDGQTFNFAAARFNPDGSPDNNFSFDGKLTTSIGTSDDIANDILIQPDGKFILGGHSFNGADNDIALIRYNNDGTLDHSFGSNGKVTSDINGTFDFGLTMTLQPDLRLLVGGHSYSDPSNNDIAILRYLSGLNVGLLDFSLLTDAVSIYPNPIQGEAILEYSLKEKEAVDICLYDLSGKLIKTFLTKETKQKGSHTQMIRLDSSVSAGPYIITLSNGVRNFSIRIIKN